MSQSRLASFVEAWASTGFGYCISVVAGQFIYPMFDASITLTDNMGITLIFTVLSLTRTYITRRFFNWHATRPKKVGPSDPDCGYCQYHCHCGEVTRKVNGLEG